MRLQGQWLGLMVPVQKEPSLPSALGDCINQCTEGGGLCRDKQGHLIAESHRFIGDQPYPKIPLRSNGYICPNTKPQCLPSLPQRDFMMPNTPLKPAAKTSLHPASDSHARTRGGVLKTIAQGITYTRRRKPEICVQCAQEQNGQGDGCFFGLQIHNTKHNKCISQRTPKRTSTWLGPN